MTDVGGWSDALFIGALLLYLSALLLQRVLGADAGRRVVIAGAVVHGVSVVGRGIAGGHLPWSTMYEFSSVVALVAVVVAVWALPRAAAGTVLPATLVAVAASMVAALALASPAGPMPPALDSIWLAIHTSGAVAASGIFTVGVAATAVWLWRDATEARAQVRAGVERIDVPAMVGGTTLVGDRPQPSSPRSPTTQRLDAVVQRVTALGFLVWTFAVLTGAVWAEQAWGRYWGWDPKETSAFVTWLLYAAALHARATPRWRGRRAAWLGVAAYGALLVTYYVVNLVVVGLHSYA